MGILVPANFDLRTIENRDEREVVRRLVDGLTDGWLIFPNVTFHSDRPHEIDVVLLHEEQGVVHLEVKGHRAYVQAGEWYGRQGKMRPQPFSQAKTNAYALRNELKDRWPGVFEFFRSVSGWRFQTQQNFMVICRLTLNVRSSFSRPTLKTLNIRLTCF